MQIRMLCFQAALFFYQQVAYPRSMGGRLSAAMSRGSFKNTTIMEILSAEPCRLACTIRRFVTAFKSSAQNKT